MGRTIEGRFVKLGFLSDAHGNLPGVTSCLRALEAEGVERIYFLGDVVGYFPDVSASLTLLEEAACVRLLGNHDAMLLGIIDADDQKNDIYRLTQARLALEPAQLARMASGLPYHVEVLDGRRLLMVHGSPWNPLRGYVYPDADPLPFESLPFDAVFMGHTHRAFTRYAGSRLLVNVGSCGLPRDCGSLASVAIYDTSTGGCEALRVSMDVDALIDLYGQSVHSSVIDCLHRATHLPTGERVVRHE